MISKTNIQLRYADTDQMNIIHHSRYFQFFEIGRLDFLKKFGFDYYKIESKGVLMPIRDVSCTYLKTIRPEEDIFVETSIHKFTKYQIHFYHEIKTHKQEVKCKGMTKIVAVDQDTFDLIRIDQMLPELYQKLLNEVKQ